MHTTYDGLALFSGGLDSILAAKVIQEQGLAVKCLHFVSPFFGKPDQIPRWEEEYGLDILPVDVGEEYAALLRDRPRFGFGKCLNPCVDCKILMASRARALLAEYGASFIISGEVLGQRPMSQRRDALDIITREAGVRDLLLRPLCAKRLKPTPVEESGLVDRERLHSIGGRGRKSQLELASHYGLETIPTPAGGCLLAEKESSRRYWPVLTSAPRPGAGDFHLANIGRQYWSESLWLTVGRDKEDNSRLEELLCEGDLVFKVKDFPGPLCIGRQFAGSPWPEEAVADAAAYVASFSPKAVRAGGETLVSVFTGVRPGGFGEALDQEPQHVLSVHPSRDTACAWREPDWDSTYAAKKAEEADRLENT